jgi:23S rRNA pseudouridine2604 synthase
LTGRNILRKPSGAAPARPAAPKSTRARLAQRTRKLKPEDGAALAPPPPRTRSPRPAAAPDDGRVRVSKLMSERGLCSRREADEYIEKGWVFVDGTRITELGTRVLPTQAITLDKRAASISRVTVLLNKPIGYVSGQAEDGYQPAVTLIKPDAQAGPGKFAREHLKGLAPAGRLDIDSTGLLVLTQDGRIAKLLIGDNSPIDKEYLVKVEGKLDDAGLRLLNHGLSLDGVELRPARVEWARRGELRFVLREGRKRQIRRMCELVGLRVTALKRIRIGKIRLGDLPPGKWRYLQPGETF